MQIESFPGVQSILQRIREISQKFEEPKIASPKFEEILKEGIAEQPKTSSLLPKTEKGDLLGYIEGLALEKGLDPNLIKAVVKAESGFEPNATSKKGAMGLMQLMPKTAESLGVEDPYDPYQNLAGGSEYLSSMIQQFGSWEKGVAAYNAGPGAVKKYNGIPPYAETQNYVEKVKKNYESYVKNRDSVQKF